MAGLQENSNEQSRCLQKNVAVISHIIDAKKLLYFTDFQATSIS